MSSERTTATADDLVARVLDEGFLAGDPFPDLARLRAEAPVARHAETGAWVFSRHDDVTAASRDPQTFCSGKGILLMEIGADYDTPPTMMHTDPPAHTRYRKLVQPAFAPSVMRKLDEVIRARARRAVAALPAGEPVDVVGELAVPFPLRVISDLLGVPEDDWPRFFEWSEAAIPGATDWPQERIAELMGEMVSYLLETAAARRADPRDDVISLLATVEVDGDTLDDTELAMFLVQLLVAGNETTRNALSGGLVALSERPDEWARLRAQPDLVDTAVDEVLRWTTPVVYFMRTTTREVDRARRHAAGRHAGGAPLPRRQPRRGRVRAERRRVRHRPHAQPPRGVRVGPPLLPRRRARPHRAAGDARRPDRPLRHDRAGG